MLTKSIYHRLRKDGSYSLPEASITSSRAQDLSPKNKKKNYNDCASRKKRIAKNKMIVLSRGALSWLQLCYSERGSGSMSSVSR